MSRTVIIGAGAIGLACGYYLSKRGCEVVVVDKGEPGQGCSMGNAGWIVPSFSTPVPKPGLTLTSLKWMLQPDSPLSIRPSAVPRMAGWLYRFWRHCNQRDYEAGISALMALNQSTMALYDALENEGVQFEMLRQGLLFVFLTEKERSHALEDFDLLERYGYKLPRLIGREELLRMEPALSDNVVGGFWIEEERHVRPESVTNGLANWLKESGAEIKSSIEISRGTRTGRTLQSISTNSGDINGDQFIIAAGAWSGALGTRFGINLPVQAGKGYSVTIDKPGLQLLHPLYMGEAKVGCSPFDGALRFAGTMELSNVDNVLHPDRIRAIRRAAANYLRTEWPVLNMDEKKGFEWMGMRPLTPDGLPIIGRAPGYNNVFIATGHAMLGITLAPATGEAIADLICDGESNVNLNPFDPARFA